MNSDNQNIKIEIKNYIGIITLDRQDALNALSAQMIFDLKTIINSWQDNDNIKIIVLNSTNPRAFCAGGDLKNLYQLAIKNNDDPSKMFFGSEYELDTNIFSSKKPIIALTHGITMGGGVGLSTNAQFCVAAPDLCWAMPETSIGFFPDAGASYFLSRVKNNLGFYIGLSGCKLNAIEALYCGLTNYVIEKKDFAKIIDNLTTDPDQDINNLLTKYTVENIQDLNLPNNIKQYENIDIKKFKQKLSHLSPTSLAVTEKLITMGQNLSFKECIELETKVAAQFLQMPDFYEGIRAKMIDKDNNPKWTENKIAEFACLN